eukprot:TRINITY_DN15446_c0_g2_i1.p2 TRINITY_DN15446_c0_g2~~TRINITY_DN15446_c0_g2_i1.p2  ORF type:complete len:131 (+),score=18.12 TRINITY_DN15446_c0_g2_i1:978-1370(+)
MILQNPTCKKDCSLSEMLSCIDELEDCAKGTENLILVLHYTGHGFMIDGSLYLVPVDAVFYDPEATNRMLALLLLWLLPLAILFARLSPLPCVLCLLVGVEVIHTRIQELWNFVAWHPLQKAVSVDEVQN